MYNILRFPLATLLLFITLRIQGRDLLLRGRRLAWAAGLSLLGIFIYQILYMTGQYLTSAANVGIVYGFTPILILLVSVASGIERPSRFAMAGIVISVSGVMMILFNGGRLTLDIGVILLLCAFICWAFYTVLAKLALKDTPAAVITAWIMLFGSLYQLPLGLWQLPQQAWAALSMQNILYLVMSGTLSLFAGYTLFYFGISRIGPARAGVYTNLMPIFAVIFAVLIGGETIRLVQVAGLLVILSGIAVTKIRIAPAGEAVSQT